MRSRSLSYAVRITIAILRLTDIGRRYSTLNGNTQLLHIHSCICGTEFVTHFHPHPYGVHTIFRV